MACGSVLPFFKRLRRRKAGTAQLQSAGNRSAPFPVTLNFDEESGQYWGTYFNQYYGDYRLEEKEETRRIFFDTVNATRLRRPERMLKPERAYFDFLYGEKIMYLTQDELVLENIYGQTLRFKAVD